MGLQRDDLVQENNFLLDNATLAKVAQLGPKKRQIAMKAIGEIEWNRCAEDVMYWLDVKRHPAAHYVYTHDGKPIYTCNKCGDGASYSSSDRPVHLKLVHQIQMESAYQVGNHFKELPTIRPFPMYDYMPPIINQWVMKQFIFIPKSRDMMATWLTVMLYTWDTIFHAGRQNIFQSDKADKTLDLVKRAWLIYKHQPKFLKNHKLAEFQAGTSKAGYLSVEELNSEIIGFPQGPDQIRQYHPSGVFQDEAAYQAEAGTSFAAIKPAIAEGGRFTAVSSAAPGWFAAACLDEL